MTNAEKFKEVFGYTPDKETCVAPDSVCMASCGRANSATEEACQVCPFDGWWNKEYKPCFRLKEELEG